MHSDIAQLRTLTLPYGATSGERIVIDGENGVISVYDAANNLVNQISADVGFYAANAADTANAQLQFGGLTFVNPTDTDFTSYFQNGEVGLTIDGVHYSIIANGTGTDENGAGGGNLRIRAADGLIRCEGSTLRHMDLLGNVADWTNLSLQNSWSALGGYDAPSYIKLPFGYVGLRGGATGGTTTDGTLLATVPAGFRPPTNPTDLPVATGNGTTARIQIETDGEIRIYGITGAFSLCGMYPILT